ncbi:hypothetical protein [Oceanithermus sp.]|uniref:hypothetical protein n=1 Tax=Oceanithermus sp. TaxID=2268145 RepID=UPI0025D1A8E4|nr:hypothetical protein [Oceanithermus sp.]
MSRSDLRDVVVAIDGYLAGNVTLDDLQATIISCAARVTEYEHRRLREQLLQAEGSLEVIRFTTDSDKIAAATLPVVIALRDAIEDVQTIG